MPDLEQRRRPGRASAPTPAVGAVMRARIFSSVLLPAPLRPIDPERLAVVDGEADVAQGPEVVGASGAAAPAAARSPRAVAQGQVVAALAEPVVLADALDLDRIARRPSDHVRERRSARGK